ncbi:MAG: PfkB family carbohydrate kinase [Verrucomicrobiota bacterium]
MNTDISNKPIDIVGLGVCTLDLLKRVDEFPGEEMVQRAEDSALQGGGPVPTALAAATKLGAKTQLIDRLGDDWRGDLIYRELVDLGIGVEHVSLAIGESSCIASVWVRKRDAGRCIAFTPGTAPELSADELPLGAIERATILHTNGRHYEAMFEAAKRAKAAGTLVSFDGGAGRYRPQLREFLELVDIAIVARDFAEKYAETREISAAAEAIRAAGPKLVGITDGTRGSWIFPDDDEPFHQPAFEIQDSVDTTGCGDVYHGAFLAGLAKNWDLRDCAKIASAYAALNTRGLGGRGALVDLATVREFAG